MRAAVVLALLSSRDLWAAESGIEAYQIDQWMSYEVKGVRIRPQLDINMMSIMDPFQPLLLPVGSR